MGLSFFFLCLSKGASAFLVVSLSPSSCLFLSAAHELSLKDAHYPFRAFVFNLFSSKYLPRFEPVAAAAAELDVLMSLAVFAQTHPGQRNWILSRFGEMRAFEGFLPALFCSKANVFCFCRSWLVPAYNSRAPS